MTTIAYRDGVLAADTLITSGDMRVGYSSKIVRRGPVLAGASGRTDEAQPFLDWVRSGCEGDAPALGDNADGFLVFNGEIIARGSGWDRLSAPFYAAGSGRLVALGAMTAGASAEEAVRAAALVDICTGGEITVLRAE